MAVLSGQLARLTLGGLTDNPNLTGDHWHHAWVNQFAPSPFLSDSQRSGQAVPTHHWPVAANGKALAGQRMGAHVDDWYHRIHISPQRLDLGNVVSAQTSPVYLWNAFLVPRTLAAIDGIDEGILVTGQPAPPLLFAALAERLFELTVTPDGQPVLDTRVEWAFDNGARAGVQVTANRIIAWTFAPDWASGVTETLIWATDILQSEAAIEQRRALRQAPRREFEAPMYVLQRERQLLDLALHGWSARVWALPLWHEIQLLPADLAAGEVFVPCDTEYLDFHPGGLAMLRGETAFVSETVEIEAVQATGLALRRATQQKWPAGSRLYPARSAQLLAEPSLVRLTDQAISCDVRFLIVEPCDWPAAMPATLYRGRPVYEARPDESEELTAELSRLLLTLDNGSAMPLYTDTASRGLALRAHRWIGLGRSARAALRSFLYAMAGRQKTVWLPTHADDLTLLAPVTSVGTTLEVAYCGYTRFANAKPGRRDIRIELFDGSVFHRRILGSTEVGLESEQLLIDEPFARSVLPEDVARISWLLLCRFESDSQQIEHLTDSHGVGSWSTVFREVAYES